MNSWIRLASYPAALLLVGLSALSLAPPQADASSSAWSVVSTAPPPNVKSAAFWGVSCSSDGSCMAVGNNQTPLMDQDSTAIAERLDSDGWSYTPISVAGSLSSVSCLSASWCMAVGFNPNVAPAVQIEALWNGFSWTQFNQPGGALNSISCASTSFCVAVGFEDSEIWNGSSWTSQPLVSSTGAGSVSCLSSTWCMAVGGSSGSVASAQTWNGTVWAATPTPPTGQDSQFNAVSCVSSSWCVAVGLENTNSAPYNEALMQWNGSSWSSMTQPANVHPNNPYLISVSCISVASCTAVGDWDLGATPGGNSLIQSWDGSNWSTSPITDPPNSTEAAPSAVSCTNGGACVAAGLFTTNPIPDNADFTPLIEASAPIPAGDAAFYGSMGGKSLNKPIVGMASNTTTGGYWEVASDGGLFAFNAPFYGSMGGKPLNAPIVGMANDAATGGYYEVASDGGIFAFGPGANFYGSMGGQPLNKPIAGMATTFDGGGYWEVASDGGIFAF